MTGWLITGGDGMLAREFGDDVMRLGRGEIDVTDREAVREKMAKHRPTVVINCAAWTDVDGAESREEEALAVNGTGPAHLAAACRELGAVLLHVSTDYVFGGDSSTPYAEDAPPAPRTAYGRTKLAGERAVLDAGGFVVRTAWLYGAGGPNFVNTMIRLEAERDTVDVVDDQRGQPTWTADLADRLVRLGSAARAGTAPPGVYHGTSSGDTTWFGLARRVFELLGADPARVRPTTSAAFPRPAARPSYSVLGHDRWKDAGITPIRPWHDALEAFMKRSA